MIAFRKVWRELVIGPGRVEIYREYDDYRKSDRWKRIRGEVLERDSHTCRLCKSRADIVHHLDYSTATLIGKDKRHPGLVSLCDGCHGSVHNAIRHNSSLNERTAFDACVQRTVWWASVGCSHTLGYLIGRQADLLDESDLVGAVAVRGKPWNWEPYRFELSGWVRVIGTRYVMGQQGWTIGHNDRLGIVWPPILFLPWPNMKDRDIKDWMEGEGLEWSYPSFEHPDPAYRYEAWQCVFCRGWQRGKWNLVSGFTICHDCEEKFASKISILSHGSDTLEDILAALLDVGCDGEDIAADFDWWLDRECPVSV